MARLDRHTGGRLVAGFAAICLVVSMLVPAGFMVAQTAAGPSIVICTGHGVWTPASDNHGAPAKAPAGEHAVCAFADHGGAMLGPQVLALAPQLAVYDPPRSAAVADIAPGLGLAAPPPPSQGPPRFSL